MILYEKKFRLDNGTSFSRYIKSLDEMNFSPYTLLISEIPNTKNFRVEVAITNPINLWGWHSSFIGGVLLNEYAILYSKGERYFTLQASTKTANLVFASFSIILSILSIIVLFMMIAKNTISFTNGFAFTMIAIIISAPAISTYLRDKKLLDRIGSIVSELKRK